MFLSLVDEKLPFERVLLQLMSVSGLMVIEIFLGKQKFQIDQQGMKFGVCLPKWREIPLTLARSWCKE